MKPYFEVVVAANLPSAIICKMMDLVENVLNQEIDEKILWERSRGTSLHKNKLKRTIHFNFMLHRRAYVHLSEVDKHICNLSLMLKSREIQNIVFFSSDPLSIVAAGVNGFPCVPVTPWNLEDQGDYQLSLVGNYLLRIGFILSGPIFSKRIKSDFSFLINDESPKLAVE
jgi:hypothetical protein